MIHLQGRLLKHVYLACSGGVDSMAALDFLNRKHDVTVLYFNHGTEHGYRAENFVSNYCNRNGIEYYVGDIEDFDHANSNTSSKEEWWRDCRYSFFDQYTESPVITCHHLDDCVETWVWSSMHGTGKWIPYRRKRVIRPFRLTRKRDLKLWAELNAVPWIEDDSNADTCYTRNYIRHEMMPHVLKVNPGIHKTVAKKVREDAV